MQRIEKTLEITIFRSRWLLAPFYLGLIVSLVALFIKFVGELAHLVPGVLVMDEDDVILAILSLVDMSLAGNLLLMVIFSGYENFVSRIDTGDATYRPEWMGKVDFSGLKLKLVASIVAISSIHLLKTFVNVDAKPDREIMWMLIIHGAFIMSGLLLAVMDLLAEKAHAVAAQTHALHAAQAKHGDAAHS